MIKNPPVLTLMDSTKNTHRGNCSAARNARICCGGYSIFPFALVAFCKNEKKFLKNLEDRLYDMLTGLEGTEKTNFNGVGEKRIAEKLFLKLSRYSYHIL